MIDVVDFSELGFRRLVPAGVFADVAVSRLAEFAKTRCQFEVETSGPSRWLRDRGRRTGAVKPLIKEVASVGTDSTDREVALHALNRRDRAWDDLEGKYYATVQTCIELCKPSEESLHRRMHFLTSAASLSPRDELVRILAWHVLPAFFSLFPSGHFVAFEVSHEFETRLGLCRSLHRFSQYPVSAFGADDPSPLQKLHAQSSLETPGIFADLLCAMTFPWITVVSTVRLGLLLVFVLDPAPAQTEPFFPGSWSAKLRSGADFARAPLELKDALTVEDPAMRRAMSLRRHILRTAPSRAQTLSFLRYSIQQFSQTLRHATDPTEHCLPDSDTIAPLAPFEFGLTFDRVLRKGILAVQGASEGDRKDDCFEIADLIEELWAQRNGKGGNATIFKKLFDRSIAGVLIDRCSAGAPVEEWAPILPAVRAAYDTLVDGIAASVVVRSKVSDAGVQVRNKGLDQEVVEPIETFTANVVRSLRNAHHGYLTANDPQNRPARYLSLVSGHLPEDVSLLAAFWAWGVTTSPTTFLERPWLPVGGYIA